MTKLTDFLGSLIATVMLMFFAVVVLSACLFLIPFRWVFERRLNREYHDN